MATIVRIKSQRDGYRRCGVAHAKVATDYPAERFSEEELERLQADPVLTVVLVDGELPSTGGGAPAPGAAGSSDQPAAPAAPAKVANKSANKAKAPAAKPAAGAKAGAKSKPVAKPQAEQKPAETPPPAEQNGEQQQSSEA